MDDNRRYEAFVRNRITELREQKGVSEHRMSLELGKSGSYIRSITNGISMPSLRELFNIMEYFDLTPTLFFAPMDDPDSLRGIIISIFSPHSSFKKYRMYGLVAKVIKSLLQGRPAVAQVQEVGKSMRKSAVLLSRFGS